MKLISLHIDNFGQFNNFDYVFEDGINQIVEENGWGKSTLAAFIKSGRFPLSWKWKLKYSMGIKVIPNQSLGFLEYKFIDSDKNELDMMEEKEIK